MARLLPHRLTSSNLPRRIPLAESHLPKSGSVSDLRESPVPLLDLLQNVSSRTDRVSCFSLESPHHPVSTRHRLHATEVHLAGPTARLDPELFDSVCCQHGPHVIPSQPGGSGDRHRLARSRSTRRGGQRSSRPRMSGRLCVGPLAQDTYGAGRGHRGSRVLAWRPAGPIRSRDHSWHAVDDHRQHRRQRAQHHNRDQAPFNQSSHFRSSPTPGAGMIRQASQGSNCNRIAARRGPGRVL
jgi:hypothetical protein